jgi:hypothetical protein
MSEPDPSFETRLESMERRLAELQQDLAPEAPPPAEPEPEPAHEPPPEPIPRRPRSAGAGEWARPRPAPSAPETPAPAEPPERARAEPPERARAEPPERARAEPPERARAEPAPPQLELLGTLYSDLLGSVRRLLDGYEAALGGLSHPAERRASGRAPEVELTAGPFRDTAALREFERSLARLPGVREVTVRGYKPGNRAILEVQLEPKTS